MSSHPADVAAQRLREMDPAPTHESLISPTLRSAPAGGADIVPVVDAEDRSPLARLEAATYDLDTITQIPAPEYLIDDALVVDSITETWGPPGSRKSFVTIGQGLSVAHGVPWMGRDVRPGAVVYVAAEGARGLSKRIRAWEQQHDNPPRLHPFHIVARKVNLFDVSWAAGLLDYCQQRQPILIVIDTLARCSAGAEENSAKDMGIIVDRVDEIRQATGACVNLIHHSGKDASRKGRGSNAIEGAVETEIEVSASGNTSTLTWHKCKDSAEPDPLALEATEVEVAQLGTSLILEPPARDALGNTVLTSGAMETLAALREIEVPGGINYTTWREQAADTRAIPKSSFTRHRKQLLDGGLVVDIGTETQPRYLSRITSEQEAAA